MAALETMPNELIATIVQELDTDEISYLSQTNKTMRKKVIPYLYATVHFDVPVNPNSMSMRLALFLQTILSDDRVADHIRHLALRPSTSNTTHGRPVVRTCSRDFYNTGLSVRNRALLVGCILQGAYPDYLGLLKSLEVASPDPALACIATQAPHLQSLTLEPGGAVEFPVVASLMLCAVTVPDPAAINRYQRLRTLSLSTKSPKECYSGQKKGINAIHLVALTKLKLLAAYENFDWLKEILKATPNLKQFEYRLRYDHRFTIKKRKFNGLSFRLALAAVERSLKVLKISVVHPYSRFTSYGHHRYWLYSSIDTLRKFSALKELSIPLVLLEGSETPETFHLSKIIPNTVQTLTFKDDFDGSSYYAFEDEGAAYRMVLNGLLDDRQQGRLPHLAKLRVVSRQALDIWRLREDPWNEDEQREDESDPYEHSNGEHDYNEPIREWLPKLRKRFRMQARTGLVATYWQSRGWFDLGKPVRPWTEDDNVVGYETSDSDSE